MIFVYHADCTDGACAAWVAWLKDPDTTFIVAKYGDEPPWALIMPPGEKQDVVVCDFSYPRNLVEKIAKETKSFVLLDHHKTAQADIEGLPGCVFDMSRSGARMAWDYFFPTVPVPHLVNYVEDRDLWRFALQNSQEVNAYLQMLPTTIEAMEQAYNELEIAFSTVVSMGRTVLNVRNSQVQKGLKRSHPITIGDQVVLGLNITENLSEAGHELAVLGGGQTFGACYFYEDTQWKFSLRSDENGADVSEIAKLYGGGGHAHAAGFTVSHDVFTRMLAGE